MIFIETNVIYNEDCLTGLDKIPDKSLDLLLTDPPYRIHAKSGGGLHNKRDWLSNVHEDGIDKFEPKLFLNKIVDKLKIFNAYIFCSKDLLKEYISFANENNFNWDLLIMAKRNPIPTKNNKYLSDKEYCIFMREKGAYFNNDLEYNKYYSVKKVNVSKNEYHSTEKPLHFIKDLVQMSSKKGDKIIDPFIGSGTTAVASILLDRKFIGYEINEKYYKISLKRIGKYNKKYYDFLSQEEQPAQMQMF